MPTQYNVLTDSQVAILQDLINQARQLVRSTRALSSGDETIQAPDVYIARTPFSGIPPRDGIYPGVAECDIYQLIDSEDGTRRQLDQIEGFTKEVRNLSLTAVEGAIWTPVIRNKGGDWFTIGSNFSGIEGETGTGTGTDGTATYPPVIPGVDPDDLQLVTNVDYLIGYYGGELVKVEVAECEPTTGTGTGGTTGGGLSEAEVQALIDTSIVSHEAETDPHSTYLTEAEGDAAYDALGAATSAVATHEAALDPHPQYATSAEVTSAIGSTAPSAHATSHKSGGSDSIKLDELAAPTDVTTLNATTTAHGLLPKLSNVSTEFLNGQGTFATPTGTVPAAHATSHKSGGTDSIKLDELAAPTDVTTLNASITAHGLLPKLANDAAKYLDGTGAWVTPKLDDLATPDDNTDLNASTSRHGLLRKLDGLTTTFLRGDGSWSAPSSSPPYGFISGLGLQNDSGDLNNDIGIASGSVRDSADSDTLTLASYLVKRLDAAWAVGSGNGGLDTGSMANGTYNVFIIKRPDTGVVDGIFSLSYIGPSLPTNYTKFQRLGAILVESGVIVGFLQDRDHFRRKLPILSISATNPGTSAVLRTLHIPTGIALEADVRVGYSDNSGTGAGNPAGVNFQDPACTDYAPSAGLCDVLLYPGGANLANLIVPHRCFTNSSAQVRTRAQLSAASLTLSAFTYGWWDKRMY